MTTIQLVRATKTYGREVPVTALQPTTLSFEAGELVVIFGPSGSGKTTLLNLIGALDKPSAGQVLVEGEDLGNLPPSRLGEIRRAKIGFVFQFYNLIPGLTVRENVQFAAELVGKRSAIDQTLSSVGLLHRAKHFPSQLSGGEQQRVAIARALVKDPAIILCDEPTGAVDFETGKLILGVLEQCARAQGRTVLIVTHNGALAAMADRVIRMKEGAVWSDGRQQHPLSATQLEW